MINKQNTEVGMASAAERANYRNPGGSFVIKIRTPMNIAPSLLPLSNFGAAQTLFTQNAMKKITAVKAVEAVKANAIAQFRFDDELVEAPDGVYTWILKDFIAGGELHRHLVSAPARTKQEIGSLHVNMDNLTKEGSVVAAGELRKTGTHIDYNISSGTYMGDVFIDTVLQKRKELASKGVRILKKDVLIYESPAEIKVARDKRTEIIEKIKEKLTSLGFTEKFLEIEGDLDHQPIANIAGRPILETTPIVLANANLFGLYKAGLKEVGWPPKPSGGARKTRRRHRKPKHRKQRTRRNR